MILNVVLFVDVMNKTFIFVKFDDMSLLCNYNNPYNSNPSIIIDFDDVVKPYFQNFDDKIIFQYLMCL